MLKKKEKINKQDLLILLSWLKSETLIKNKKFEFETLLNTCYNENTDDVEISDSLEPLMHNLLPVYDDIKELNKNNLEQAILGTSMMNMLPKNLIDESVKSLKKFVDLYESLIMDCKFDYAEMRCIQKTMFNILISKYIIDEDYEKCAELKQKLSEV